MNLPSEPPALRPIYFLQDRREIGGQAIQFLTAFVELSVVKEWTCKHLQGVGRVPDIGTVGKVLHNRVPVPYAEL
ncbi:MAG: hypothetical protein K2N35_11560, partial [Muribaculaceae bacterium]|nr:hypothetical protein [Muribaculaceae bacterium]